MFFVSTRWVKLKLPSFGKRITLKLHNSLVPGKFYHVRQCLFTRTITENNRVWIGVPLPLWSKTRPWPKCRTKAVCNSLKQLKEDSRSEQDPCHSLRFLRRLYLDEDSLKTTWTLLRILIFILLSPKVSLRQENFFSITVIIVSLRQQYGSKVSPHDNALLLLSLKKYFFFVILECSDYRRGWRQPEPQILVNTIHLVSSEDPELKN